MKQYIFLVEGSHDLAVIGKILNCIGYRELRNIENISENFRKLIPQKFPFSEKGDLDIFNVIPAFFKLKKDNEKECKEIVIINSNGESKHFEKLDKVLDTFEIKEKRELEKVIVFSDSDTFDIESKIKELIKINFGNKSFINFKEKNIINRKIDLEIKVIDIEFYIFPDNKNIGRLENLVFEGIKKQDNELLEKTIEFINLVPDKYKSSWSVNNSQKDKTIIGTLGNVLYPCCSAPVFLQKSRWISENTCKEKHIKELYEFLLKI